MSCTLYWKPVRQEGKSIGDHQLRDAIREEFGDYPIRITQDAVPFLRGLAAAKVDGARNLCELIEKYGSIQLWIEC
jgi:hypothetical protein